MRFQRKIFFCVIAVFLAGCNKQAQTLVDLKPLIQEAIFWNLDKPLLINVNANDRKGYRVYFELEGAQYNLSNIVMFQMETNAILGVTYPEGLPYPKTNSIYLKVKTLRGIREKAAFSIIIDNEPPVISVIAKSPFIKRGGSALVVIEAIDENIQSVKIVDDSGKEFFTQAFKRRGYFIGLIGWDISRPKFSASIIAKDMAGNKSINILDIETKPVDIVVSKLTFQPNYVEDKVDELAIDSVSDSDLDSAGQYNYISQALSKEKKISIPEVTSIPLEETVSNFFILPFSPIETPRITSPFGKLRKYYYEGELMKESYHTGLDMASLKESPIQSTSPGKVIFADYNGGYGNTVVLSHGMGLYSMYAHCSAFFISNGENTSAGTVIARTGSTGVATGDHVHLSILVQGVYVDPVDWMNDEWLNSHIFDVIEKAERRMFSSLEIY